MTPANRGIEQPDAAPVEKSHDRRSKLGEDATKTAKRTVGRVTRQQIELRHGKKKRAREAVVLVTVSPGQDHHHDAKSP